MTEEIEEQAEHQACAHIGISAYKRNPDAHSLFKTGFRVGAKFGMKKAIEGHKVTTEKISIVEKENAELKQILYKLVNAFNDYECAGPEQEQENTWEILRDLMHEELFKLTTRNK